MKRDPLPVVKKINPFFWKLCEKCGKEFRSEFGWKLTIDHFEHSFSKFVCAECFSNPCDAEDYFFGKTKRR